MFHDKIDHLLHEADSAASAPRLESQLSDRVRVRQIRAMRRRRAGALATIAAIACAALFAVRVSGSKVPVQPALAPAEVARLQAEADLLATEADAIQQRINEQRSAVARYDLEEVRRNLAIAEIEQSSPEGADLAALIALGQGDFYSEFDHPEAALAAYKTVVTTFPSSRWASLAHEKLDQLEMN